MFVLDRAERGGSFWQLLIHASGGGIYLETAATVTTFLLAGRLYEARARRVAGQAMRELAAAGASDAGLLSPDGTERRVPVSSLRPGDRFVVRPGEAIAADGEVVFGQSAVDRSMMTGESAPGEAVEGDSVIGGTVALTGRGSFARSERARHPALATDQAGRRPGAEGCRPADRGPDLRRVRPRRAGLRRPHARGMATGRIPRRARGQRRARRGHHRVPVRARPGDVRGAGGCCGRGAWLGIFIKGDQAWESSRLVRSWCWTRRGRSLIWGGTVTARRRAIQAAAGRTCAGTLGAAGAGVRARGVCRDHRGRVKRNRSVSPEAELIQGAVRARGAWFRRRLGGHCRPLRRCSLCTADRPGEPGPCVCRGWEGACRTAVLRGGTVRTSAPSRSPA